VVQQPRGRGVEAQQHIEHPVVVGPAQAARNRSFDRAAGELVAEPQPIAIDLEQPAFLGRSGHLESHTELDRNLERGRPGTTASCSTARLTWLGS
jgi:hypothetical protein